jgi:hypothetical protein
LLPKLPHPEEIGETLNLRRALAAQSGLASFPAVQSNPACNSLTEQGRWGATMSLHRFAESEFQPFRYQAVLAAIMAIGISTVAAQQAPAPTSRGPHIAGCPVFPADNVWNATIDKLPLDPHSADYVAAIGADKGLHPDFASDLNSGIPFNIIDAHVKYIKVTFEYAGESDLGNYPIPPNPIIEGGPNPSPDSDRHILLVDKDRCMLMEVGAVTRLSATAWKAGAGIKMDLTGNGLRADGNTSADAAGLPVLPGLVRYDEVAAGEIRHALRFTVLKSQQAHVWPARHDASRSTNPKLPPMGARFRLRADFDISGFSKPNQVILTALKRYGMFLADNGADWFLSGAPDARWNDDDLHLLGNVKGSDFEVVDESDWQYLPDSARIDPTEHK